MHEPSYKGAILACEKVIMTAGSALVSLDCIPRTLR